MQSTFSLPAAAVTARGRSTVSCKAAAARPAPARFARPLGPKRIPSLSASSRKLLVTMAASDVFALDFDGIICDSCGESSLSAWKAAEIEWPDLFNEAAQVHKDKCMDMMREVRPVVEVGYENVLLVRLLLEAELSGKDHNKVGEILAGWEAMAEGLYSEFGVSKDAMLKLFGDTRDDWIRDDFQGWMEPNAFYAGIGEALRACKSEYYIVTTKQGRFASALLDKMGGVQIPDDSSRMYALGSGPKKETLKKLGGDHPGARLIFVEDRLATLMNVIREPGCEGWELYLGDWGYNTEEERAQAVVRARRAAAAEERIQVIDLAQFAAMLRDGKP